MSEAVKTGKNENKSGALQKIHPGGEAAGQTLQSSQSGISALGMRGAVLQACDAPVWINKSGIFVRSRFT